MKKKATVLIASIMAFCGINTAHADEGMWTIYNLPNAVYEMMQRDFRSPNSLLLIAAILQPLRINEEAWNSRRSGFLMLSI